MTTLRKLPMSRPKTKTKPATTYGDRYSIQAFQMSLLLRLPESVKWIKLARRSIVKVGQAKGRDEDLAGLFGKRNGWRRSARCGPGAGAGGARPRRLPRRQTEQPVARAARRRHRFVARDAAAQFARPAIGAGHRR